MIVAWQFIARETSKKGRPSQRDGIEAGGFGGIHLDLEQRLNPVYRCPFPTARRSLHTVPTARVHY